MATDDIGDITVTPSSEDSVGARYARALDTLTESLKQDRTILAAILCGSLSYDQVWEKSDIDLALIGDEKHKEGGYTLTEEGINIHAMIFPRSAFKKAIVGGLRGSFLHSFFSKSRLLYTHDPSLLELYEDIQRVGARDQAMQLLLASFGVLFSLPKAEKWFHIKKDNHYSFVFILRCTEALAKIEVISHRQIPTREVIQQAMRLNPDFFRTIYTDLIDGPKDDAAISGALTAIQQYMVERQYQIFQPVLEYLAAAGGPRTATEIDAHFKNQLQSDGGAAVCEWLAEKGVIERVSVPLRLSERSRVTVNEAAYYYDGEGN